VSSLIFAVLGALVSSAIFLLRIGLNEGRREQKTETELKSLREQINGVGKKVNENQAATDRRIRNLSTVVQFIASEDKEKDVASLLRES
jgi:signal transduction histidine kinase